MIDAAEMEKIQKIRTLSSRVNMAIQYLSYKNELKKKLVII